MSKDNNEQVHPKGTQERASEGHTNNLNPIGGLVGALIPQVQAGNTSVEGLEVRAGGLLQSIASDAASGLQGAAQAIIPGAVVVTTGELAKSLKSAADPSHAVEQTAHAIEGLQSAVQVITAPASTLASTTGELAKSLKPPVDPSLIVGQAIHVVESSVKNSVASVSNVANTAANSVQQEVKRAAIAFALARIRGIILAYLAKLPVVGPYFKKRLGVVDTLVTETTPLLGALRDPTVFATKQTGGLLRRPLALLLSLLPDIDALDNVGPGVHGLLFKVLIELYVLVRDGGGWLFTHLQEHSLVVAPVVSLGHLSTTDLAASTIGTAVASVTGYSIIQGFVSSLDKHLAEAPNRHAAKIACAQAAVITGVVLFPITNLWAIQSGSLLQRLGQPPKVAASASQFLQVTAAGLPGYAIGEIAKRYLASQGLSRIHTRILSATAPMNLILNYLLVDGPIPALRLGFIGAPLCTVLSHNMLATMLIIYIVMRAIRDEVGYIQGQNTVSDEPVAATSSTACPAADSHSEPTFFTDLGVLILSGLSGVAKSASQLWSKDFGGVVACILGPNALATQAVLLTTATTLYQAPKAMSSASENRMKKWITKGDVQRAQIAAVVALVATVAGVIVIGNILLASSATWGKLFNNDPVIIKSVAMLLPTMAAFQAVHGLGAWVDCALGSLGKPAVFPSINASADYILGIPLGVYLALGPQHWGLGGLWVGLAISLAYSFLVSTIVLVRTNWKNAVVKVGKKVKRVGQEARPTVVAATV